MHNHIHTVKMFLLNLITEFLFTANYNWMPPSKRSQPSEYLVDLIAYLQGAFITFDSLPVSFDNTQIFIYSKLKNRHPKINVFNRLWIFVCKKLAGRHSAIHCMTTHGTSNGHLESEIILESLKLDSFIRHFPTNV